MFTNGEYSPLRQYRRIKEKRKCILRLARHNKETVEAFFVETLDYSEGGLGILFDGEKLSVGKQYFVYVETLNIVRRAAEIIWLKCFDGSYKAGLRWL